MKTLRKEVLKIRNRKIAQVLGEIDGCGIELPKMVIETIKRYITFTAIDVDELNEMEKGEMQ